MSGREQPRPGIEESEPLPKDLETAPSGQFQNLYVRLSAPINRSGSGFAEVSGIVIDQRSVLVTELQGGFQWSAPILVAIAKPYSGRSKMRRSENPIRQW